MNYLNNIYNGFTTHIKKCNNEILFDAPLKKKIIYFTPSRNNTPCDKTHLLNAPKKNKVKTFFKNIYTSNNH